ncbi:MAG: phage tail tape measure protein, partial [Oceanospirillaceae bacterium]|nr:phage tail tape measure protein [Oceanospirillaceae bacterium]
MANIEAAVRKTRAEFKHLQEGTAEYEQKARELQRLNGVLTKHRQRIGGVQGAWKALLKQVKLFSPIAIAAVTARALYSGLQKLTERLAKLSDAYADVSKTTGMTIEQVKQLDKQLLKLNTRTSRDELLKLAKEAGKLGITGVENIRRFVEQADKINVSLGEDLGEGAIIQIGKLANIFKTDMERIGSAINEVGASSVASEQWQVDFLNRMAGIAETAQLSLPDLLGYGAALENLGQTAEVSGTAMTQLFLNLVKNTEEFGQMAGFAEGELSKLIGEQGTSAGLAAFLKKLQESSTSTADLATKLDKLGIDGVRAAGVLLTLSNNTGLVAEQQQIANKAFEQNTSLQAEFAKKNDTLQASLDRMAKRFDAIKTSLGGGWLADAVKGFADFIAPVKQTNELINEERLRLNMLVGAIVSTNTNNELRKQYIDEIKTSYPAFNEMVQGDYTNHTLLAAALKQTNQEYLNKIILQRAADKHAEAINDQADAYYNLDAATQRYQQRLVGLKGLGITQDANESNQSFLNRLNFLLKEGDYTRGEKSVISLVAADLEALIRVTNDYTKAEKEANAALDDQEALRQKLGDLIKPNPVTGG